MRPSVSRSVRPSQQEVGALTIVAPGDLFCACRSREVALESAGHGHFTTRATAILNQGIAGLTNGEFQRRVITAFGANSGRILNFIARPSSAKARCFLWEVQ